MKTPDMKSMVIKNLASFFRITLLASAQCVSAHVNHNHSYITETAARMVGKDTATKLTVKEGKFGIGKLAKSWSDVPNDNVKLVKNGDGYYIVSVFNDAEEKVLYVFMSSEGVVSDANFTGEFAAAK